MSAARLRGTEFVGMAAGALLVLGLLLLLLLLLLRYATDASSSHSDISLRFGFCAALAAALVMIGAAANRSSESERPRTPTGAISWTRRQMPHGTRGRLGARGGVLARSCGWATSPSPRPGHERRSARDLRTPPTDESP